MTGAVVRVLLEVVLPVFAVSGVGLLYAARFGFPRREVAALVIRLTGACLVFDVLASTERLAVHSLWAPLSGAFVVLGGIVLGALLRGLLAATGHRVSFAAAAISVGFMNAGNLGLPLAELAYGPEGLTLATLFFVTLSVLHYTLGVALAKGAGGVGEVLRLPLVYAAAAGVWVNQAGVALPAFVAKPIHLLGQTVIPLMLLSLGASLLELSPRHRSGPAAGLAPALALALGRVVGGLAIGLVVVRALGTAGTLLGDVTVLVASLPPAVLNFVVADRYDRDPATVAAAVAFGTAISVATTPLVLAWF